jgi:outer membrane lipoprotein-sorting protein
VLEKEIITSDGEKIFVYKRKLPKEEQSRISASMPITKLKVYPNPGDGKFSLSFTSNTKADVEISITDAKGTAVYSKTIDNFSGEYFNEVNISDKGKGTYYLKITQGEDSITKKILVE